VFYVEDYDWPELSKVFLSIHDKPVLTITYNESRVNAAGIINLIHIKEKLRFQIFMKKVDSTNLKLSSRLIKLAVNKN
jgi:hypothetical protein